LSGIIGPYIEQQILGYLHQQDQLREGIQKLSQANLFQPKNPYGGVEELLKGLSDSYQKIMNVGPDTQPPSKDENKGED
jgi:polyhydroxyalkanoate synthesis regulator protein